MLECRPDWRWHEITGALNAGVPPEDEFLAQVYAVIRGDQEDATITHALQLYALPHKRDVLVAFLLSKADFAQVCRGTWVPEPVVGVFEKLFLDRSRFTDKMDLRLYAKFYMDKVCEENNRMQIEKAITEGPYALLEYWRTGSEVIRVPDEEIASRMVSLAYAKLSVAGQESVMSNAAKEAMQWGKLANANVALRNRLNPAPADKETLLMDIKSEDETVPTGWGAAGTGSVDDINGADSAVTPDEILH